MNDDLLERAARTVRERYDGQSEHAARTEDRLLAALRRPARRHSRLSLIAIPLVAAVLASAAWGTVGKELRAWLQTSSTEEQTVSVRSSSQIVAPKRHISAQLPSAPLPDPPTPVAPLPAAPSAPPTQRATTIAKVAPPSHSAAVPSESEIDDLYRTAHRAQFFGADPARAVVLWDRYLAAAPNGSLSPDARYNRAIALVRLGRKAEAATALEPFARGEYGGYRKTEATSLLEGLRPHGSP
jgi:hypothetical protein